MGIAFKRPLNLHVPNSILSGEYICSDLLRGFNPFIKKKQKQGAKIFWGNCPDKIQEIPFILLNPVKI